MEDEQREAEATHICKCRKPYTYLTKDQITGHIIDNPGKAHLIDEIDQKFANAHMSIEKNHRDEHLPEL
jgi:hypothetical protein